MQHFKEKVEILKHITEDNDENKIDMINLQKDVVVFHGEMVLLENYCSLNYIGKNFLKIPKWFRTSNFSFLLSLHEFKCVPCTED